MPDTPPKTGWKGPTIREIADLAGVGPASVDRVLNNRPGVKEKTRKRVMTALDKLNSENSDVLKILLFCESGETFNGAMELAAQQVNRSVPKIQVECHFVVTSELEPNSFASRIEEDGLQADGVVLVAREHPAINRAVRHLTGVGVPVVCMTSDLPSSRRSAYIGNDQSAAGSVAGQLIGQILSREPSSILLVMSVAYRTQQERELGFRRVLRSEFPHLKIEERLMSDDLPKTTKEQLTKHFDAHGLPAAIYNVAGANRGVAEALQERGAAQDTIFVGHELTENSVALLEARIMDYVISHDFGSELTAAVQWIKDRLNGVITAPRNTQILVHTRYNCDL
jgi:LacI family transcriptional regulator